MRLVFDLPPFDPSATFIVAAWPVGHTIRGHQPKRGEVFDKTIVSESILRSMYQSRWITTPAAIVEGGPSIPFQELGGAAAEELIAAARLNLEMTTPPARAPTVMRPRKRSR